MDEEPLQFDGALYRSVVDHGRDMVTLCDPAGRIVFQSPAVERELGWPAASMAGRDVMDFLHPDDVARIRRSFVEVLTGEPSHRIRLRMRAADGSWHALESSGTVIQHDGRDLVLINSRYVTELEAVQRDVRVARELLAKFFSSSRNLKSVSSMTTGKLTDVNEAWLSTLGWRREEVIGRTSTELGCWGEDAAARQRIVGRLHELGRLRDEDVVLYPRDGEARSLKLDAELIEIDGEGHALFSGADVTDQQRVEEQLRQAQKMEALGQLTGGVAHDFNNLLGVVMGNAELVRDLFEEDPAILEYIDPILDASARGATLTQQLLAFARQQTLAPEPLRLDRHVDRLMPMLQTSLDENVTLNVEAASDLRNCRVDAQQLGNALLNLVLNARDAMASGGVLTIRMENRTVRAGEPGLPEDLATGDYVALHVTDTGCGMAPELVQRAFDPFFTTKEPGRGTGLGLSMEFGFSRQSGGTLQLASALDRGTTVTMLLPSTEEPTQAPGGTVSEVGHSTRNEHVLLLEDNEPLRTLLTRLLERLGYRVSATPDEQAFEALLEESGPIDAFVSDVVLTGSQAGPELAERLRARHPSAAVLFISGYPDRALDLAAHARVLNKPFSMEAFSEAVRGALDERRGSGHA